MNQREIKFRAWDGEKMYEWPQLKEKQQYISFLDNTPNGWTVMQFTGLKLRGQVDVYEGDLLRGTDGKAGEVKFLNGFFTCCFGGDFKCYPINGSMEVIGNVYENPELLGQSESSGTQL